MLNRPTLLAILALTGTQCFAQTAPPPLRDGQVISADVLNDLFHRVDHVTSGVASSGELTGQWTMTALSDGASIAGFNPAYIPHPSGIYLTMNDTMTFIDNNNGSFSYATVSHNLHPASGATGGESGSYLVAHSILFLQRGSSGLASLSGALVKLTKDKFMWKPNMGGTMTAVIFERSNLPPAPPTNLTSAASGLTITLSWNAGTDATGFKLLRKDTLEGLYVQIGTPTSMTFTDTVPAAGDYWYRVVATNAAGDSLGSNVAKVSVTQ